MKSCQAALLLLLALVLVASSPAMAAQCSDPEHTCYQFIKRGPCDAGRCMSDCAAAYNNAGEGQCFPQGCRCSYCCNKPRLQGTTAYVDRCPPMIGVTVICAD
ncbi:hypothetical protein BRADI_3g57340v3 [Brachypodium distachyon]|uniref:Uncharacterized protein n=1 Tax=Brachypodium distachyon TaxID=15368 RepID=I1IEM7_BRADI|nr:hypothetical protein BRADI_3g57340v3 [Brachypodium distachyon]